MLESWALWPMGARIIYRIRKPPATHGRTQIIGCVFTAEGLRQIAEDIRFYRTNSNFGIRLPLGAPHFACTCMYMYVPRVDPYDRALVAGGLGLDLA